MVDLGNSILASLVLGAAFRQLVRFQTMLLEFSNNMAGAENNKRKAIEYQNMMTPRWLVAAYFLLLGVFIYLVIENFRLSGWEGALANVVMFVGGLLISAGFSALTRFPSTKAYAISALKTLANREADFRRARDTTNMEAANHFHWLLSSLTGLK